MTFKDTYKGEEPIRVNKLLAQSGICSRREAEDLLGSGQIRVDGVIVGVGYKIEKGQNLEILADGKQSLDNKFNIIYHKPVGIVSGQPEKGQVPAIRMINRMNRWLDDDEVPIRDTRIPPVGRLDKDSRGLLILSQDGVFAKAIIGPESMVEKEYLVKAKGYINAVKLKLLRHGLELDGRKLRPAIVEQLSPNTLNFTLQEGRNRQIRRMCDEVGLEVIDLFRIRIGNISISDLPQGKWRTIRPEEKLGFYKIK